VPARIELERADWKQAAELAVRRPNHISWDAFPSCEAITQFARGIGAARSGQLDAAQAAIARLDDLVRELRKLGLTYWERQIHVQMQAVQAWVQHADGQFDAALATMRSAAEAEDSLDKHPVTPGALLTARDLYGDMLIETGRFAEALEAYEAILEYSPNRFYSLAGAGMAAEKTKQRDRVIRHYSRLLEIAGEGDSSRTILAHARSVLAARPSEE
jgi:tetratricopeptide (TPR) repeat protein